MRSSIIGVYLESLVVRDELLERVAKLDIELKTAISDTLVKIEEFLANDKKQTEQDLITKAENKSLECILSENIDHTSDLNAEIKRLESVSNTLNQGLVKARTKSPSKSDEVKDLKVEIKQ